MRILPKGEKATAVEQVGNSICYRNFFGKETFLNYTPTLSGVKEDIVLSSYAGVREFSFEVETNGLFVFKDEFHYYLAKSLDDETRILLGDIEVYDAVGRPSMGQMTVEELEESGRYLLTVSVDEMGSFHDEYGRDYPG